MASERVWTGSGWAYVLSPSPALDDIPAPDGPVSLASQRLVNVADPTASTDADTKGARDSAIAVETARAVAAEAALLPKAGGAMTGDLAMGGHSITGAADPVNPQDVATRAFVLAVRDALIGGAPGAFDTLVELYNQLQSDESAVTSLTNALAAETTARTNGDTTEAAARVAADALLIPLAQRAAASGVATLDASTRLTFAQKALRVLRSVTAATTIVTGDDIVVAGGTTAYTVTLPDAASTPGREFTVKRTSTGVITVGSAGGTIDGAATQPLNTQYQALPCVSDGTNWLVA